MAIKLSPADIENALSGVTFPTNKQNIINYAKSKNVPREILGALNSLPNREFTNSMDISHEISGDSKHEDNEEEEM